MSTITRSEKNPLIKPADVKPSNPDYRVLGAFNPGATTYRGKILLLLRVAEDCIAHEGEVAVPYYSFEDGKSRAKILTLKKNDPDVTLKDTRGIVYKGVDYLTTISHIRLAESDNGVDFIVNDEPFIAPSDASETLGVEDARVSKIGEDYYINYTGVSRDGYVTNLIKTRDFKSIERLGTIFPPLNKDVAIFEEKIGGSYFTLHRPHNQGFGRPSIWIAKSPDLLNWGGHKCILRPLGNKYDNLKIGGGAPPLKTDDGWLIIFHSRGDNNCYSLQLLLLDINDPYKIIAKSDKPILIPETKYEKNGFFGNVIFSNGTVIKDNKLYIYYGASDETSCVAVCEINALLDLLK